MVCAAFAVAGTLCIRDLRAQEASTSTGADWRSRPILSVLTNSQGAIAHQTNTLIELRGGMNRWDAAAAAWVPAKPELRITDAGIMGTGARHSAHFAANINTASAVEIQLPGQAGPERLQMQLLGLFYEDSSLGTNVLISDLQDSAAQVIGDQIYYPNAFESLRADVIYRYAASGISQEILLKEPLPDPQLWRLSAGSVQVVAISEIVGGPEPVLEPRSWQDGSAAVNDETLDFGSMRMVPGRAFRLGAQTQWRSSVPVAKEYRATRDARRLILERIPYSRAQEELRRLPIAGLDTNQTASVQNPGAVVAKSGLPTRRKASAKPLRVAQSQGSLPRDGFVLDWELASTSLRDFSFECKDSLTYLIEGDVRLLGTTTIKPGAVVRFGRGSMYIDGPLNLPNTDPVCGNETPVLTSGFDETAGPAASYERSDLGNSAVVVRPQDYRAASQHLAPRHPWSRILPDRPMGIPAVHVTVGRLQASKVDNTLASFVISRSGGDLSQPLTVGIKLSGTARRLVDFEDIGSSVTIPAAQESVDVPVYPKRQNGQIRRGSVVLTIDPDPQGSYACDGTVEASVSVFDAMVMTAMSTPAPSGLVGWWKAEGNANDSSGGNQTGGLVGGATYDPAGEVGQTFKFDGLSGYVEVPHASALNLTDRLTIEFWVKRLQLTGAFEYLVEKGGAWNGGNQNFSVQIHGPDNDVCFTYNGGYRMAGVINDLAWHHVAVVAINTQANPTIYIDGLQQTISQSSGGSINLFGSTLPLHIGAQKDTSWNFYSKTEIDEMSLYNSALSASDIQAIYNAGNAGKTPPPGACVAINPSPVAWWSGDNTAADVLGNSGGSFGGTYIPAEVNTGFCVANSASTVRVSSTPAINVGTSSSGMSIEGWIRQDSNTYGPFVEWAPANGYGAQVWLNYYYAGSVFVNLVDTANANHYFWTAGNLVQPNQLQHVAVTYDKATGYIKVYVDGVEVYSAWHGTFTPQTSADLYLGYRPPGGGRTPWNFSGVLDEVSLYDRVLSPADVSSIYNVRAAGKCRVSPPTAPTITAQPQSQTVASGANTTLSVSASGSGLTYQWYHNSSLILGATSSALVITGVHLADAGDYKVVVANPAGSVASSSAVLTVLEVAVPVFSPAGGPYASARNVTVSCSTPGAVIHYNLSGTVLTQSDPLVSSGSTVLIDHDLTLAANAWKSGYRTSDPEIESYHIGAGVNSTTITVSPPTGSSFLACDDIPIIVQASNPSCSITKIQLFRDGVKLAETAQSPLEYTVKSAWSGTYTFTARAIDSCGFVASPAPVTLTVTAPGPNVTLRGLQPFFTDSPGTLLACIVGVDPGTLRSLGLNGAAQPVAVGAFTLNSSLAEGNNTFTLVATDNQSRSGQATATVTLDSVPPVVSVTAPANNSSFGTTRIDVSGTFVESSIASVSVNGVPAFLSGATWTALNVPLGTGANMISAIATDLAGNAGNATITINGMASPTDAVQLTAAPVGGFAPLQVTFQLHANVPGSIQQVLWDFDGDGVADQTFATVQNLTHTYSAAGQFFPVVTVVTSSGRFSSSGGWNGIQQDLRINVQASPIVVRSLTVTDPVDLKCTPDGNLYVLSRTTRTITEFNSSGGTVRSLSGIGSGPNCGPNGLDVDSGGNVYVAITGDNQVRKFDPAPGSFVADVLFNGGQIGRTDKAPGAGDTDLNAPFDVALSPDGKEIAISDSGNHRVQRFNSMFGTFIDSFGAQGNGPGQMSSPNGVAYDEVGYLYVVDSGNARIVLSLSSDYEGASGGAAGPEIGQFQAPVNIATGPRGIYVADTGNNRIQFFDHIQFGHGVLPVPFIPRGVLATELGLNQPKAVAVLSDYVQEKVCIADTGNNRILIVTLPCDAPDAVWSSMRQQLMAGNIPAAISYFAKNSAETYRQNFLLVGSASIASMASQMPSSLIPIYIENATAQYRFEQTLGGRVLSFPVDFVKENGSWKVAGF
jgi:hypothetical protein